MSLAASAVSAELVLASPGRVDELATWLRAVHERTRSVDAGGASFLVVTPLGWAGRERLREALAARGVQVLRRVVIPSWPRVSSAIRITRFNGPALRRAARFEAAWEGLFPATPAEAWALPPGSHARVAAMKGILRAGLPSMRVDLGDGWPFATLHPFHVADLLDARDEARRLIAALSLIAERRRGPLRRLDDLAPAAPSVAVGTSLPRRRFPTDARVRPSWRMGERTGRGATMTNHQLELEDPRERQPGWKHIEVHDVPESLWRSALASAEGSARRERIALDLEGFVPLAAATLDIEGRSMGQVVMTVRRWRGAAGIRFGGVSALLVAELDAVDEEAANAAIPREGVGVSVVPFGRAADAARVVLEDAPGYRL